MTDLPPQDEPPAEVFAAADREVFIRISDDRQWIDFCRATGLDEVAADPRFVTAEARLRHRDHLHELLSHLFTALPAEECLRLCAEAGVPAGLVDD
jgi:crotonobetainyl-CoA:carnitine CoA-transferase CaiB-like acyl-CoA transferase